MHQTWTPPHNYENRPVAILGAGVLGRRIGCVWASAGYNVRIRDPSSQQRTDGISYIEENVASYAKKTGMPIGTAQAFESLEDAVANAWLVIEAVPEQIEFKIDAFEQLEKLAPTDCILTSNSSSYKSSAMLERVSEPTKSRILNMHYYMPPQCMIVELMTDGYTEEGIFPFLVDRCKEGGTLPYVARKQSTGFIFNRLWAAVKRETLTILAEGVSVPEEIDSLWTEMFIKASLSPCKLMDDVGLDTVAFIESHYVEERGLSPVNTVNYLKENYLTHGKLGSKSPNGGLYPPTKAEKTIKAKEGDIVVLDIGLAASTPTMTSGAVLQFSRTGRFLKTLVDNQSMPDGICVDPSSGRLYWTNMGSFGQCDGSVQAFDCNTRTLETIVPKGAVNTPKQLTIDNVARKIYFCDREGLSVYRCNLDGSQLEKIVHAGDPNDPKDATDTRNWCVGIAVAPKLGKFYWTQKGPSKGGQGRIFCANISTPLGGTAISRSDIECIASALPEPIDLEIDEECRVLYWTDRGELPYGNSLNCLQLNETGRFDAMSPNKPKILTRHFKEAIGLKLDIEHDTIVVTDLGGNIYRCDMNGEHKSVLHSDDFRAFTGVAFL